MAATENSGVFGTGTFDNARFDTINQPSNIGVFSSLDNRFNLSVSSFAFVFSDLGKEIQRDLTSFVGLINSNVDAQKQILRTIDSFTTVFSTSDFRLGKKVISTINAFSKTDSTINVFRDLSSNINIVGKTRQIYKLSTISTIRISSLNKYYVTFNRSASSFIQTFSKAFIEITPRDTSIRSALSKAQSKISSIKKQSQKTLSGDINK